MRDRGSPILLGALAALGLVGVLSFGPAASEDARYWPSAGLASSDLPGALAALSGEGLVADAVLRLRLGTVPPPPGDRVGPRLPPVLTDGSRAPAIGNRARRLLGRLGHPSTAPPL